MTIITLLNYKIIFNKLTLSFKVTDDTNLLNLIP